MTIETKDLGVQEYLKTYELMRDATAARSADTSDEIWLVEHPPVYTLGLSANREHLINTGRIPVVETDRGGHVTFHGAGQLLAYLLIDLNRRPYKVKRFVSLIEQSIIDYLSSLDIDAVRQTGAPGVYVDNRKIAALGVRVKKGCTYHGLAMNVKMDLRPFAGINPCGYAGLKCTQLSDYVEDISLFQVKQGLTRFIIANLDQSKRQISNVA